VEAYAVACALMIDTMLQCDDRRPGDDRPRLNRQAGQMLIFCTLSLVFMFGVMGLSVDLGYSYSVKVQTQAAADAAAAAAAAYASANRSTCGSSGVVCGSSYSCVASPAPPATTAMQAGCLYAKANGFVNSGNQTVALIENNTTPPNETGNAPNFWVQATVTQTVPIYFFSCQASRAGPWLRKPLPGLRSFPRHPACTSWTRLCRVPLRSRVRRRSLHRDAVSM